MVLKLKSHRYYSIYTNSLFLTNINNEGLHNHTKPLFDNGLGRDFASDGPDQAYVQDIIYIWTQKGWLYLATVIDQYSRRVVGWSMGSRMTAQLVCDALTMAIWQRQRASLAA